MSPGLVLLVASVAVLIVVSATARAAWRERRADPPRVAYPTARIEDPLVAAINRTDEARGPLRPREKSDPHETSDPRGARPAPERRTRATGHPRTSRAREVPPSVAGSVGLAGTTGPASVAGSVGATQPAFKGPTWVTRLEAHPTVIPTRPVDPDPRNPIARDDDGARRSA